MTAHLGPLDHLELVRTSLRGLKVPGHVLRQEAVPLDFDLVPASVRQLLARQLLAAMHRGKGIGLAAPMVGLGLRAIVAIGERDSLVMVNPKLIETGDETSASREGNLCLPGVSAVVKRPKAISVTWQDLNGTSHERAFEGYLARTLQHELEILDGRIFTDLADKGTFVFALTFKARAAVATAFVLDKPAPVSEEDSSWPESRSCVTLPPAFAGLEQSILRRPAKAVQPERFKRNQLRELVEAMFRLQHELGGVGLAAPQIGYGLRLAVIDSYEEDPLVLLNPKILERSESEETLQERCLSIPGWEGPVARATELTLRNHSLGGKPYEMKIKGRMARIVQHEYDHLDGVFYSERVAASQDLSRVDPETLAADALSPSAPA